MLEQLTLIWYAIMLSTSGMLREQAARTREGDSSAREIRRGSGRSRDKEPVTNRTSITVCQRPCCAPRNVLVRVSAASVLARQPSISVRVRVRSVRTHARVYRQKRNHQLFVLNYPKQVCRARTHARTNSPEALLPKTKARGVECHIQFCASRLAIFPTGYAQKS